MCFIYSLNIERREVVDVWKIAKKQSIAICSSLRYARKIYKKIQKVLCANMRHLFVGLECKGRVAN